MDERSRREIQLVERTTVDQISVGILLSRPSVTRDQSVGLSMVQDHELLRVAVEVRAEVEPSPFDRVKVSETKWRIR